MTLDYNIDGKVPVKMADYINNMLESLPESMGDESAMPASNHLFTVNPCSPPLCTR